MSEQATKATKTFGTEGNAFSYQERGKEAVPSGSSYQYGSTIRTCGVVTRTSARAVPNGAGAVATIVSTPTALVPCRLKSS